MTRRTQKPEMLVCAGGRSPVVEEGDNEETFETTGHFHFTLHTSRTGMSQNLSHSYFYSSEMGAIFLKKILDMGVDPNLLA